MDCNNNAKLGNGWKKGMVVFGFYLKPLPANGLRPMSNAKEDYWFMPELDRNMKKSNYPGSLFKKLLKNQLFEVQARCSA